MFKTEKEFNEHLRAESRARKELKNMKCCIKIGIDIDGVLRDNLGKMVEIYNKAFNENITLDDVKDYCVSETFPRIEAETDMTASEWFSKSILKNCLRMLRHSHQLLRISKGLRHSLTSTL